MTPANLSAMWREIAPGLGNHLWQSTLFAVAAGLLTLILRKNHARARYWLWLAASVKFLVPFSLLVDLGSLLSWSRNYETVKAPLYFAIEQVSQPFPQSAAAAISPSTSTSSMASASLLHLLPGVLATAWLCGFAAVLFTWCVRWRRVSAARREAAPLLEGREVQALRRQERIAGMRTPIEIVLSGSSLEPGIFGVTRPVLIWPEGISEHLEDAHLEAILAHEVWHVRRRDNLAAAIHMVVEALFWFHPLVWWLGARLVEERECACDEEVVELGSERRVYAESILKVCEFCVGSPLACVSGVAGSDLKKRMVYIMTEHLARKLNFAKKLLLSTAGVLALALPLVFGVLNAPQIRAQEQPQNLAAIVPDVQVSIKPSELSTQTYAGSGVHLLKMMYSPTGFRAANASLETIMQEAYGVQASQIANAPEWIKTAAYDVDIEAGNKANDAGREESPEQRRARGQRVLQELLADRFQLQVHQESRELPSYALVVAEDGSKLQPAKTSDSAPSGVNGPERRFMGASMRMKFDGSQAVGMEAHNISASDLAAQLSRQLGSVVVDKTGLGGNYDFKLNWTSDAGQKPDAPASEASTASLLTALQEQLGLKLEPQKAPMEVLVIDHVEKPTEN
jgi:bla regulator protein BlaR1